MANRFSYDVPDISRLVKPMVEGYTRKKLHDQAIKERDDLNALESLSSQALLASMEPDVIGMRTGIFRMAREMEERGLNSDALLELANTQDKDELSLGLAQFATKGKDARKAILDASMQASKPNKIQFGGQEIFKDDNDNFFFATSKRNPMTGAVKTVLTGINHNEQPQGKFSMVSNLGLTPDQQVTQKANEAAATKTAQLKQSMKYKPMIESAVAEARAKAKGQGDAAVELAQRKAALPGLKDVVSQLKQLAPVATNTFAGRAFDTLVKEFGFGSTDGATARAKYISIIDNQVLPLLKPTFGAAFTVQEGENLKATLGDPNASAEAKIAALDAFFAAAERQITILERQGKTYKEDNQPAKKKPPSTIGRFKIEVIE